MLDQNIFKHIAKKFGANRQTVTASGGFFIKLMIMAEKKSSKRKTEDPCWKGYEQVGMKKQGSKEVPNCVPEKKSKSK